jgi:hypothetical protein
MEHLVGRRTIDSATARRKQRAEYRVHRPGRCVRDSTLLPRRVRSSRGWRAVLEKFPERFLSASDYRPPIEQHDDVNIQRQRSVLGELSPSARQLVAFGNAWRLLTGSNWA